MSVQPPSHHRRPGAPRGAPRRSSARRAALTALAATAAIAASAGPASAATLRGSSKSLTATLTVGTHNPTVGRKWPLVVTATWRGRPARATVTYEYLYDGAVVAVRAHHTFTARFSDALLFPAQSVGYPLTFRAAVTADGVTVNLDYTIQVRR